MAKSNSNVYNLFKQLVQKRAISPLARAILHDCSDHCILPIILPSLFLFGAATPTVDVELRFSLLVPMAAVWYSAAWKVP
jgi:hypothetical protein